MHELSQVFKNNKYIPELTNARTQRTSVFDCMSLKWTHYNTWDKLTILVLLGKISNCSYFIIYHPYTNHNNFLSLSQRAIIVLEESASVQTLTKQHYIYVSSINHGGRECMCAALFRLGNVHNVIQHSVITKITMSFY